MKKFICDNCLDEFGGPLDEEYYTDEHKVTHVFDLCAPCRKILKSSHENENKKFFKKLLKE